MINERRNYDAEPAVDRSEPELKKPRRAFLQGGMGLLVGLAAGCAVIMSVWSIAGDQSRRAASAAVHAIQHSRAPTERVNAIRDLVRSGPNDAAAIRPLIACLFDADTAVRVEAVRALGTATCTAAALAGQTPDVKAATAALLRSLKDRDPAVRRAAADALVPVAAPVSERAAVDASAITAALAETLGDGDAAVRAEAITGLGSLGLTVLKEPPPELVAALHDESIFNRVAAISALVKFHQAIEQFVPILFRSFEQSAAGSSERAACIRGLSEMIPPRAADAGPALLAGLKSPDRELRFHTAAVLKWHEPGIAVAALVATMKNEPIDPAAAALKPDPRTWDPCCRAAQSLAEMSSRTGMNLGPEDGSAVAKVLTEVIKSGPPARRYAAAEALKTLAANLPVKNTTFFAAARAAVPVLVAIVNEPEPPPGRLDAGPYAAIALARIARGVESPTEIVQALTDAIGLKSNRGQCAIQALRELRSTAAGAVPALIRVLHEPEPAALSADQEPMAVAAARALGDIAPGTSWEDQAISALALATQAKAKETRAAACVALAAFKPKAATLLPRIRALAHDDPAAEVRKSAAFLKRVLEAPAPR